MSGAETVDAPPRHGATRQLAEWASTVAPAWSGPALAAATNAFADTVAVMVAASSNPALQRFAAAAASLDGGAGACTIAGSACRATAAWAALANGAAAHYLDFDDVFDPSQSHASAVLVPAILALAETRRSSGAACLDAYIVGLEVLARLGEAMNLAHYARGWHATSTIGTVAAAAACARLLALGAEEMRMALSLATSMAGGSKVQFGTFAKPMHAGLAAKNGILAAHLASMGTEAADEALEGAWGYVELTCGDEAPGFEEVIGNLGHPPAIMEHGLSMKLYPCCSSTHRPVDALVSILQDAAVATQDVERVEACISEIASKNLRFRRPVTPAQARFSLEYCLAVALLRKQGPGLADFLPEAVLDPKVQELLQRIDVRTEASLALPGPRGEAPHRIELAVQLRDGTRLSRGVEYPLGHPRSPVPPAQLKAKFDACVGGSLAADARSSLWLNLCELRSLADIGAIMEPLAAARLPGTP